MKFRVIGSIFVLAVLVAVYVATDQGGKAKPVQTEPGLILN